MFLLGCSFLGKTCVKGESAFVFPSDKGPRRLECDQIRPKQTGLPCVCDSY